jgi:hypothetical protein
MLAEGIARRIFEIDELREHAWNPLRANPGQAVYLLLARDFAPLPDRLAALAGRLAHIPETLAVARAQFERMPTVHLETAIGQFDGTIKLVTSEVDAALRRVCYESLAIRKPSTRRARPRWRRWPCTATGYATPGARKARSRRLCAGSRPRTARRFARKLSLTLSAAADADAILARAEQDLYRITEDITELAAELGGTPREVLGRLAAAAPDDTTILRFCADALAAQTAFVREHDLVTLYDDPVELIDMPEIDRGIAVAYCDSPGPLETAPLPTFIAVSPVPANWTPDRKASLYREYNRHMAQPWCRGDARPLPAAAALAPVHRRYQDPPPGLRAFTEGWAVYTEELMARHGYPGEGDPRAVRMQQLKMQLRTGINAILTPAHAYGMTEAEAMALMTGRGFQEEGEAAGKWRWAPLTSAQLSTYYVGYTEVATGQRARRTRSRRAPDARPHARARLPARPPAAHRALNMATQRIWPPSAARRG